MIVRRLRQRQPRQTEAAHLAFLRTLPCVICHREGDVHAAHIRYASVAHGKRETGAGEKPSDRFAVPLCGHHHLWGGKDAQHSRGEKQWWPDQGINDPLVVAALLWLHSGDESNARLVIEWARSVF